MHSALTFASLLLAASTAFASPASRRQVADKTVRVILENQSIELGSQTIFRNVNQRRVKNPVGSTGPFETIEINVGPAAQQNLRCQALDVNGRPLVATRGANVDTTFSDAGKGPWTFQSASEINKLVCDPTFKAAPQTQQGSGEDFEIRVILQNQADELGTQTVFESFSQRAELPSVGSSGPYDTVEISIGASVNPATRCQLLDESGTPIVATRGANTDTTFSDADKGPWTFEMTSEVSSIICDPAFVAAPQ